VFAGQGETPEFPEDWFALQQLVGSRAQLPHGLHSSPDLNELPHNRLRTVTLPRQYRLEITVPGANAMSSIDFELDSQMSHLESEWREADEASNVARADLRALEASSTIRPSIIEHARERLNRSETLKARIMAKIESLEGGFLGHES
jgi:hypothetical protein